MPPGNSWQRPDCQVVIRCDGWRPGIPLNTPLPLRHRMIQLQASVVPTWRGPTLGHISSLSVKEEKLPASCTPSPLKNKKTCFASGRVEWGGLWLQAGPPARPPVGRQPVVIGVESWLPSARFLQLSKPGRLAGWGGSPRSAGRS